MNYENLKTNEREKDDPAVRSLILSLFDVGIVKFGKFKLKSGIDSPIYIDLRMIVSFPKLLQEVSNVMLSLLKKRGIQSDFYCGVAYTALPIATVMSLASNVPMVMCRKEGAKAHGTKKQIEGVFQPGQSVLVIEDVVTTGSSVAETVQPLQDAGLVVKDVCVLIDREEGASKNLSPSLRLHHVFTKTQLLNILESEGKIINNDIKAKPKSKLPLEGRLASASHILTKRILQKMIQKKTNLCVSADVTTTAELFALIEQVGPYICVLKTHIDILEDYTASTNKKLVELAEKYNFVIFEDRKFADIGNTVFHQYTGGIYKINQWSDLINAHALPGSGIIQGLQKGASAGDGLLLIAQMSSENNLLTPEYTKMTYKLAESHRDFVIGFISKGSIVGNDGFLYFTPGIKMENNSISDGLGQTYQTPESAFAGGTDIIIVGRDILQSSHVQSTTIKYKEIGWNAYLKSIE